MDLTNLKSVRSKLRDLLYKAFLFDLGKSADVFNFADATAPASPSSEINVTEETVTPVGDAAPVLPAIGDVLATVAASAIPLSQDLSSTTGGVEPSSAQPVAASSEEPAAPTNTQGGECMCTTASLAGRLIANAAAPFTEEQRASLEALGEATLTSLAAQYEPPVPVTPATPTPAATETQVAASAPVNRQLSEAEFLAICPDNYRTVLLAAQHARETNRANLLTQLSGKVGLPDTSLQAMSDNDLQALANAWRGANPQVTGLQGVPVPPQLVGLSDADRKVYTNPPDPWNLQARIAAAGTARQTAGLPSTGGN